MAQRQFRSDDTSSWDNKFGNGSDGDLTISSNTTYDGANSGCSGTSGSTSLTLDAASSFSDGDLVLIHQTRGTGAGNWELNRIASGGGSTSITLAYTLTNTYTDSGASQAQIIELKQYSSVTVNSSQTWSATAWDGNKGGILAFLCNGTTTVDGTISASGKGYRGGLGGNNANAGTQGEGEPGIGGQSTSANGVGGGAGIPFSGGGVKGNTAGNAGLTTIFFGGAGGGGNGGGGAAGTDGGTGGGLIGLFSVIITVTANGLLVSNGSNSSDAATMAGGAGSGGPILLKGQVVTLNTTRVTATGGSGGTSGGGGDSGAGGSYATQGTDGGSNSPGGNGGTGRVHLDYLTSFTGTTNPTLDSRQDESLLTTNAYMSTNRGYWGA